LNIESGNDSKTFFLTAYIGKKVLFKAKKPEQRDNLAILLFTDAEGE